MDALILSAVAVQVIQRSYEVISSLCEAIPKQSGQFIIEITSADGKTSSQEIISSSNVSTTKVSILDRLAYHIETLYLFTCYDVKTAVLPWTLFGIGHAVGALQLDLTVVPSWLSIIIRVPQVFAWIWINLLAFTIGNQRRPDSIKEDVLNKPYRPIAAKRISPESSYYLMLAAYAVAFLYSLRFGGAAPCLSLMLLGYLYNDLGGGNTWTTRNLLNGLGYISFGSGAMEVALGRGCAYSPLLVQWLRIIVLVITTLLQAADLHDQEGDRLTGRTTLPIIIGDGPCRWTIAIICMAWSFYCPYFWSLSVAGYVLPILGGMVVAKRVLTQRSVAEDKKTYKLWNLWLMAIYTLPMAKAFGA